VKALSLRARGLRETARLLRRRPGSFLLAVALAAAAFTLPLTGASIALSTAPLARQLPLGPEVNLFLAASTPAAEVRQLQSQLAAWPGVARVEWVTREAALKQLAERTGGTGLVDPKANPLPDVLVVTLSPAAAPADVESALAEMRRLPRVDAAAADAGWHRQLRALLGAAATASALAGGLVALLLALVTVAAVQLQLAVSADQVRRLRLAMADRWCIVRPFAYAGALTLGLGMLLAVGLTRAGLAAASAPAAELARSYGASLALQCPPAGWLAATVLGAAVVGGLLGTLGGYWALRRND